MLLHKCPTTFLKIPRCSALLNVEHFIGVMHNVLKKENVEIDPYNGEDKTKGKPHEGNQSVLFSHSCEIDFSDLLKGTMQLSYSIMLLLFI